MKKYIVALILNLLFFQAVYSEQAASIINYITQDSTHRYLQWSDLELELLKFYIINSKSQFSQQEIVQLKNSLWALHNTYKKERVMSEISYGALCVVSTIKCAVPWFCGAFVAYVISRLFTEQHAVLNSSFFKFIVSAQYQNNLIIKTIFSRIAALGLAGSGVFFGLIYGLDHADKQWKCNKELTVKAEFIKTLYEQLTI